MWRATWSITDHKFSDFYQCWSRASWKFQSIDTRISFISNHCFVLFFFSGLYLCTVLSQRFHSVHIFLIWRRLFEASSGVAENIVFSAFQTLFISTFSFQSIFNSEPLFSICRADINMRLVIHYTIVLCISALLPGLVADPRSQQQSKVTLCKYKESCNALSISYWPLVWSLPVVTDSFCKDLIDMTLADKDAETFFMVMFTVMLLLMLMTLTMLLTTFLIPCGLNCNSCIYSMVALFCHIYKLRAGSDFTLPIFIWQKHLRPVIPLAECLFSD